MRISSAPSGCLTTQLCATAAGTLSSVFSGRDWGLNIRVVAALSAAIFAWPAFAQMPVDQLAKPPADAKIWTITSGDGSVPHGQVALWTDVQGTHWSRESLNLRGIVTEVDEQNRYAADGSLASIVIRGS